MDATTTLALHVLKCKSKGNAKGFETFAACSLTVLDLAVQVMGQLQLSIADIHMSKKNKYKLLFWTGSHITCARWTCRTR